MAFSQTQGFNIQSSEPTDARYLPASLDSLDPFVVHNGMPVFVGGKLYVYQGADNTNVPSGWEPLLDQSDIEGLLARIAVLESSIAIVVTLDTTTIPSTATSGDTVGQITISGANNPTVTLSGPDANKFSLGAPVTV